MKVKGSTFFLSTLLVCGLAVGFAQQLDVDRELEEAKALYREAKFAQAIAKLQATIGRLEQLRDIQARRIQLSDAHLHLALSYVALNDPTAAKESLKQMLRADRNRKLDPDVYAPKVIELFEEARAEVAKEPATAAAVPAPASSPQAAVAKKGGSKAPLIVLGVGAAAGGVALAAKGGGSSTVATPAATPTTTPTPTATPTPAVSGQNDIVFLGSNPPPGSTISASTGVLTLSLRYTLVDRDNACLSIGPANAARLFCARGDTMLRRGTDVALELRVTHQGQQPACAPPISLPIIYAVMGDTNCNAPPMLLEKVFDAAYRYVP